MVTLVRSSLALLLLITWLLIANQAQNEQVSKKQIALNLVMPNGKVVEAAQREGKMLTISFDGKQYGLVSVVRDDDKRVLVKVFELKDSDKGQLVREIESLELVNGEKSAKGKLFKIRVKVINNG